MLNRAGPAALPTTIAAKLACLLVAIAPLAVLAANGPLTLGGGASSSERSVAFSAQQRAASNLGVQDDQLLFLSSFENPLAGSPIAFSELPTSGSILAADAMPAIGVAFVPLPAGQPSFTLRVDSIDVTSQTVLLGQRITFQTTTPMREGAHEVLVVIGGTPYSWTFVTRTNPRVQETSPIALQGGTDPRPHVSASFHDVGSGIDPARTMLSIDGLDVTALSVVGVDSIAFDPQADMAQGMHTALARVFDLAGNQASRSWNFLLGGIPVVAGMEPIDTLLPHGSLPAIKASFSTSAPIEIDAAEFRLYVKGTDVTASAQWVMDTPFAGHVQYVPTDALADGECDIRLVVATATGLFAITDWSFDVDLARSYQLELVSPANAATVLQPDVLVEVRAGSTAGPPLEVLIGGQEHVTQRLSGQSILYGRSLRLVPGVNAIDIRAVFPDGTVRQFQASLTYAAGVQIAVTSPADWSSFGPMMRAAPTAPGGALDLTGTVERPIVITGVTSAPVASVLINQQLATLGEGGESFTFDRFFLHEGTNTLAVLATDLHGRTSSAFLTVFVDQTAPLLSVEVPLPQSVTSAARVDVAGVANDAVEAGIAAPEALVEVLNETNAGRITAMVSDRHFIAADVPLEVGPNRLRVTASDQHHNTRVQWIDVTRIAAGSRRVTVLAGNRQHGPINDELADALVVAAMDADGLPIADLPVHFDVIRGTGDLHVDGAAVGGDVHWARNQVLPTDAAGRSAVRFRLGSEAREGGDRVRAWVEGVAEDVMFTATAERGAASRIVIYGASGLQYAQSDSMPLESLTTFVHDSERNAVPGTPIRFVVEQGDAWFTSASAAQGVLASDGTSIVVLADKAGLGTVRPRLGTRDGMVRLAAEALDAQGVVIDRTAFQINVLPRNSGETSFTGVVLDHVGTPVEGVRLSIGRTSMSTMTDQHGRFLFDGQVPAGRIDLFVDGRDVDAGSATAEYPALHFESAVVQGQLNQLPHAIYLPPIDRARSRIVGGDEDVVLTMPGFEGFEMLVHARSVTFPDGSHVGPLVVAPVHNDRLPMVPPGASGGFMTVGWTIQPTGTRFDPPIQVKIPNTAGMKPGQSNEIVQWDHDLATFVPMGRATVSEDGTQLVTDAGSGITKAGWGGGPPPVPPNDGDNDPPECPARMAPGRAVSPTLTITAGGEEEELVVAFEDPGVDVEFIATVAGDCTNATIQWTFGDGGSDSTMTASHTYAEAREYTATATVTCPDCGETLTKNVRVIVLGVKITAADIKVDQITVEVVAGSLAAQLKVTLVDDADGEIVLLEEERASGTHQLSFKTSTLEHHDYVEIHAKLTVDEEETTAEKAYRFKVLGTYRHTKYNTPDETECRGAAVDMYYSRVTGANCTFTADQILSDFKAATDLNGNGRSIDSGLIQIESFCLRPRFTPPADAPGRSYRPVTALTFNNFTINTSTIAICPGGADLGYGDSVLIVGLGGGAGTVKSAADRCPACCDPAENGGQDGHVDNYTDEGLACGRTAVDVGNFLTIKLID